MPRDHDPFTCHGCAAPLGMAELADLYGETVNTLYKWSRLGQPWFPRAARKPNNKIVVRCRDAHAWLEERAR